MTAPPRKSFPHGHWLDVPVWTKASAGQDHLFYYLFCVVNSRDLRFWFCFLTFSHTFGLLLFDFLLLTFEMKMNVSCES